MVPQDGWPGHAGGPDPESEGLARPPPENAACYYADTSRLGETVVIYRRRFGAETYTAIVVINRRQETFTLKTFYVGI